MSRLRDLFAGYTVSLALHHDLWVVQFLAPDGTPNSHREYAELEDATHAIHEWALILADDEEVQITAEDVLSAAAELERRLREAQIHELLGESGAVVDDQDDVQRRAQLRSWFERQMDD